MSSCDLCGESAPSLHRLSGLDVCDGCRHGALASTEGPGWSLNMRVGTAMGHLRCELQGTVQSMGPMNATFRRLEVWQRWLSGLPFFGLKGLDDPLFQRTVKVWTDTPAETLAFLGNEHARSAVMDLVGEDALIELFGGRIRVAVVHTQDVDGFDPALIQVETMVLCAHLAGRASSSAGG